MNILDVLGGGVKQPAESKWAGQQAWKDWLMRRKLEIPWLQQAQNFMGGGYDVTATPMWQYGKGAIGRNFDLAEQQALTNLPRGGTLLDALTNLRGQEALGMAGMESDIAQREQGDIFNYLMGAGRTSPQTLAGIGGMETQRQTTNLMAMLALLQDIGAGMGGMGDMSGLTELLTALSQMGSSSSNISSVLTSYV
jgi:hypothetical protein